MKLMTKAIAKTLPPLGATEKDPSALARVKFFTPWTYWTWYATEFDPQDGVFFGLVVGHEIEFGHFALSDLEKVEGPWGLRIERDLYWDPAPITEIEAQERQSRQR